MTERPTEQTSPRLSALNAHGESPATSRPPLAARVQQRFGSAVDDRPAPGAPGGTTADPTRTQTSAPVVPGPPRSAGPVLPPPAPEQESARPAAVKQRKPRKERTPRPVRAAQQSRPPRRARLRMTRIDPWSVMKTSFLLSIALGIVTIVSVLMVWSVLGAAGVWDSINTAVRDIVGDQASTPFTIQDYLGTDRVIGFTMLVAVIDVVLLTAIATLSAFLYNMAAALLGGIDITLVEDEH